MRLRCFVRWRGLGGLVLQSSLARRLEENDAWIAATALFYEVTLVACVKRLSGTCRGLIIWRSRRGDESWLSQVPRAKEPTLVGTFCGTQSFFSLLGRDNCNGRHAARLSG